ncbi:undecaprenyl-diphosphatase [Bacillus benzoevorans]|uniref:Undecaprenyl-diphosphatase n=1 Tax=Bacillus benzoevorans TaxID=1456 RepID=A0A7X0HMP0_9BACI|nr:undecaprenyl-diphosphatase [Bacillus benzoevorans]
MRRSRHTYIVLGIAVLLSIFFIVMAGSKEPLLFDRAAAYWSERVFSESSYSFFNVIAELGDKIAIGIIVLLMIVWFAVKRRDFLGMAVLVLAVALGNEVSKWIKELVARERPASGVMEESFSFPSGHAMVGLVLYMLIAYFFIRNVQSNSSKWWLGSMAAFVILLIGLSRIAIQAHYLTDVLGGYTLGIVWTFVWILIYEWLHERFGKK